MEELNNSEKRNILKSYLGEFFEYFNDEEEDLFDNKLKDLPNTSLIKADDYKTLKKIMCYLLLKIGRKVRYIYTKSNDIVDSFFEENPDEESYNFSDFQNVPLLVIYHPRVWKRNKILWETLNYLCETRNSSGKSTIIISDAIKLYDDNGSLTINHIVNLSHNLSNNYQVQNSSLVASFTGTGGTLYDD